MNVNPQMDCYRSHPKKLLRVHTQGVKSGVLRRTDLVIADVAALFHDFGKLNPNFQPKLDGIPVTGYSSHAYLSAYVFLCFCQTNPTALRDILGIHKLEQIYGIVTMIAHHHGNLSDQKRILSTTERQRLVDFLDEQPSLPVSDYLRQWLEHSNFDVLDARYIKLLDRFWQMQDKTLDKIADKLAYFLDTQFGFACLVEADKRDAGDNSWYKRDEQLEWARSNFASCLHATLKKLQSGNLLNQTRTAIRSEAEFKLKQALANGHRIFTLTAPTGSGKTFTLLSLANEIRSVHPEHAVIYALPFLTITEQVESICRDAIFKNEPSFVTRIDSRVQNKALELLLAELETDPEKISDLLNESFSMHTFDAAFVVTTFVQLFETLLSNRGATLLRLPNFSKCIFLLDEIQALPPRLYVFLAAYLQAFCEKFDSFAIFSTATMPALDLPDKDVKAEENATRLFVNYRQPTELLNFEHYYSLPIFDRYQIQRLDKDNPNFEMTALAKAVQKAGTSCLVILNTIDDTRKLYGLLDETIQAEELILLNTRFILDDRRAKIAMCHKRLEQKQRTILISTQLIEAGVDVDFPVVFRDLCPLPSLIQSAGRCNRNGKLLNQDPPCRGQVWFFELHGENGKSRAELIYRDRADRWILDFARECVTDTVVESDLLQIQRQYFALIGQNLAVGDHKLYDGEARKDDNLIRRINEEAFEIVGSFRLIDENVFGHELRYYVPRNDEDDEWDKLDEMTREAGKATHAAGGRLPYDEMKRRQVAIDSQLRKMSGRLVQIRILDESQAPPAERRRGEIREVCGIRKLLLPEVYYSFDTGIDLIGSIAAIL